MKRIPLRNTKRDIVAFAIIDNDDSDKVSSRTWSLSQGYVASSYPRPSILLHHFILGKPAKGLEIDHINHNGLDNRKDNLRFVTRAQNNMNRSKSKYNKSGFIGVSWYKALSKWRAYTSVNDSQIHLGYFDKKDDAISARKEYNKQYFNNMEKTR
jgi:hypothetical protein